MRLQAILLALLLPAAAGAQEAAPALPQDPRAPRFSEVERGLFTGFEVGYLSLFKSPSAGKYAFAGPASTNDVGGRTDGFAVTALAGYDVTDRIALSLFGSVSNSQASVSYGAFSLVAAGGDVRVALLGTRDAYDVSRLYVYLHARAGYLLSFPEGLFTNRDMWLAGGPGLEYFTHLRHFSIGLAVDAVYVVKAQTPGLSVAPTVRYTF